MKKVINKIKDILSGIFAVIVCLILAIMLWLIGDKTGKDCDPWDCYQ
nr:MAG TPA: Vpu protein [Caudoviricetes sp.]